GGPPGDVRAVGQSNDGVEQLAGPFDAELGGVCGERGSCRATEAIAGRLEAGGGGEVEFGQAGGVPRGWAWAGRTFGGQGVGSEAIGSESADPFGSERQE